MDPFCTGDSKSIVFYLNPEKDCHTTIKVHNGTEKNMIYSVRTNAKTPFMVKPTKFYLRPNEVQELQFSLRKARVEEVLQNGIPTKDKIEINALEVSPIFLNVLISHEKDEAQFKDTIRSRFHQADKATAFMSCDNSAEKNPASMMDIGDYHEVAKKRLSIVYQVREVAPQVAAVSEPLPQREEKEESPVRQEQLICEKPTPAKNNYSLLFVLLLIWSATMVITGMYFGGRS